MSLWKVRFCNSWIGNDWWDNDDTEATLYYHTAEPDIGDVLKLIPQDFAPGRRVELGITSIELIGTLRRSDVTKGHPAEHHHDQDGQIDRGG